MARKNRSFTTFNLSFLDIMSCGFGAVVLVFLIIDHSVQVQSKEINRDLVSEVNFVEEQVEDGKEGLVRLRNTLSDVDQQLVEAQGRASRISDEIEEYQAKIEALRAENPSDRDDIEKLKADIALLEAKVKDLRAAAAKDSGRSAHSFIGTGHRQYLTGLRLGGHNIAILLDVSSSMLADKLVNIIRLRNMGEDIQRKADKWTRSVATVDWLTAQLPLDAHFQVITFNTAAHFALPGTEGKWLEVADRDSQDKLSAALHRIVPTGGTSLENAFAALRQLSPPADNIFLITDGLPTQGRSAPSATKVSGRERQRLFNDAVRQLPEHVPVNIILEPLEGDPMAAAEFWRLAQATQGSLLSPSKDWP